MTGCRYSTLKLSRLGKDIFVLRGGNSSHSNSKIAYIFKGHLYVSRMLSIFPGVIVFPHHWIVTTPHVGVLSSSIS